MADLGERLTDLRVERIRRGLDKIYAEAAKDLQEKAREYLQRHYAKDKLKRLQLSEGKITKEQYRRWQSGQVFIGKQW